MRTTAAARTCLIAAIAVVGRTVTPSLASAQPGTGSARTLNAAGAPGSNGADGVSGGLGGDATLGSKGGNGTAATMVADGATGATGAAGKTTLPVELLR